VAVDVKVGVVVGLVVGVFCGVGVLDGTGEGDAVGVLRVTTGVGVAVEMIVGVGWQAASTKSTPSAASAYLACFTRPPCSGLHRAAPF
jgi:hypothetical protein